MRVTVIIATRDRTAYLRHALLSVAQQTRPADEVIVVDDGDGGLAAEVCRDFAGVICLRSGGHGLAAARNIGTAQATGDIVIVQDDDDIMLATRIADHLSVFSAEVDATYGAWVNVTLRPGDAVLRLVPGHAVATLEGLLRGNACLAHGAAAYRTATLRAHPYAESLQAGSDMDLHARLLAAGARFQQTNSVVLVRRLHAESVTQRFGEAQKVVKDALKARHLTPSQGSRTGTLDEPGANDKFEPSLARPRFVPAHLDPALDMLQLDGARGVYGTVAKTLAALSASVHVGAGGAGGAPITLGQGGFVDVLLPRDVAQLSGVDPVVGLVPRRVTSEAPNAVVAGDAAVALGLADGGGRILIDIDGLDVQTLVALNPLLSTVSPSWRFVAKHPVLDMAFADPPELAIASNRYGAGEQLARAFKAVAAAAGGLGLPVARLAVAAVHHGTLIGLKV